MRKIEANNSQGFTLLEMVIAISIFAIIGTISYSILNQFILARTHLDKHKARISKINNAFTMMGRDLRFLSNRPIRNGLAEVEGALLARNKTEHNGKREIMRLTTAWKSSNNATWSLLERVRWHIKGKTLVRSTWQVLDQDQDSKQFDRELLNHITSAEVIFYTKNDDKKLTTKSEWVNTKKLPLGAEVIITMDDSATYRRVFSIASHAF